MKRIVTKLAKYMIDQSGTAGFNKFLALQEHEGWGAFVKYLLYIRVLIQEDMLSREYTDLPSREKDIVQRAYFLIDELLLFLASPVKKLKTIGDIKRHNKNQLNS